MENISKAFVTQCSGDGKPYIKMQFQTLDEMYAGYGELCAAVKFHSTEPSPAEVSSEGWHAPGLGEVHNADHSQMIFCSNVDDIADDGLAQRVCQALSQQSPATQLDWPYPFPKGGTSTVLHWPELPEVETSTAEGDKLLPPGDESSTFSYYEMLAYGDMREQRALNQRLAVKEGDYIDGVNMDRLVSSLSIMGVGFTESREALCAPSVMADHINRLTRAVMGLPEKLSAHPVSDDQQAKDAALSSQPVQVNIGVKNGEN